MKSKEHGDHLHESQAASKIARTAGHRQYKDTFKKLVKLKAMRWRYWITLALIILSLFYGDIWAVIQTAVYCCFGTIAATMTPVTRSSRNENATQTEVPVAEGHCTETRQEENNPGTEETDSNVNIKQEFQPVAQYRHLKQSLRKVFECAYSQFVLLWYDAPEPRERQVLHQALLQEFHNSVDHLIHTTQHLETMTLAVGAIRILNQHLRISSLNEGKKQSQCRDEELALLRKCSESLIRNLLPPSLWGLDYMQHLVNEVVSLKVLDPLISMLSDPDHLNQWVVNLFDAAPAQLLAVETVVAEAEVNPPQEDERADEPQDPPMEETENAPEEKKKKMRFFKHVFSKLKIKKKNKKQSSRKEDADPEPGNHSFRRLENSHPSLSEADTEDLDSGSVISYTENFFVFSYEVWKVGYWEIMVLKVWEENEDLSFTIHIEERDHPFQWNVKQTLTAFRQLLSCLKEAPGLSCISDIVESWRQPADDEFLEKARLKLEDLLKKLVLKHRVRQSEEFFSFLQPPESPLESDEPFMEVWRLVNSVVSFFAPGEKLEEDQNCSEDTVILDKINGLDAASSALGGGDCETDSVPIRDHLVEDAGDSVPPQAAEAGVTDRGGAGSTGDEVCREDKAHWGDKPNPGQSNIAYRALLIGSADSECNLSDSEDSEMECCIKDSGSKASLPNGIPPWNSGDVVDCKCLRGKTEKGEAKLNTRQEAKTKKPEKEVTKAIFELLKEITDNSLLVHCFKLIPSSYLAPKLLSKLHLDEKQVTAHIENLCEKLWPNGIPAEPSPERTHTEKTQTKERAEELLLKILSPYSLVIKAKHVKSVFTTFQDLEANKTLLYMLFLFLCKALVPGDPSLNTQTIPWLKRPL